MENSVCFVIIIHPEHTQYVILLNNLLSGVNRIFFFFLKVVLCIELSGHLIFRYTCSRRSSLCCNLSRREFSCGAHTAINYSATVNMEKHV